MLPNQPKILIATFCSLVWTCLLGVSCAQTDNASVESTKELKKSCQLDNDPRKIVNCAELSGTETHRWQEVFATNEVFEASFTNQSICEKNPFLLPVDPKVSPAQIRITDTGEAYKPLSSETCELKDLKSTAIFPLPGNSKSSATQVAQDPAKPKGTTPSVAQPTNQTQTQTSDPKQKEAVESKPETKPATKKIIKDGTKIISLTVKNGTTYFKLVAEIGGDVQLKQGKACVIGSEKSSASVKSIKVTGKISKPNPKEKNHLYVQLAEPICDFKVGTKGHIFLDHFNNDYPKLFSETMAQKVR